MKIFFDWGCVRGYSRRRAFAYLPRGWIGKNQEPRTAPKTQKTRAPFPPEIRPRWISARRTRSHQKRKNPRARNRNRRPRAPEIGPNKAARRSPPAAAGEALQKILKKIYIYLLTVNKSGYIITYEKRRGALAPPPHRITAETIGANILPHGRT